MISVYAENNIEAFKQSFSQLWQTDEPSDRELLKESPALVVVERFLEEHTVGLNAEEKTLEYIFPWQRYFPFVDGSLITEEIAYWNKELFGADNRYKIIVDYLKRYPESKRAILDFWQSEFKELSKDASCLISAFFRINANKLNIHVHARASNVSFLFFMDLQVMRALQNALARELGLSSGEFIYFSSSLHAYASQADNLEQLKVLMSKDTQWQM